MTNKNVFHFIFYLFSNALYSISNNSSEEILLSIWFSLASNSFIPSDRLSIQSFGDFSSALSVMYLYEVNGILL